MAVSDLSIGSELLGYRVERVLGRGGMGVVYLAADLRLRRTVALKLLAPPLSADEGFRKRFLTESKLAASLDHPCVVPIYEAGEADGQLFIAMRFVEGHDLKALLRVGPLTVERAVRLCAQVADGLDFAHEQGLVHRDVKPGNVLLDRRDHVYLADFGLTKRLEDPATDDPRLVGTLGYMAPEQLRGDAVDGRADQYALGCVLYECLVGERPFERSNQAAVMFAHLNAEPPAPPGLEVVMQTALAKEPGERYRTCGEFVVAAAEALGVGERARSLGLPFGLGVVVCPFKGLSFFDRSDAEYFCGRERVVSEVVARLAASRLVGILGPSGIGKSSLLRAGVLPALSAGALPGSAGWRQVLVRPGERPCEELMGPFGGQRLQDALAALAGGERIVVAIDQLEELFTACQTEQERAAFLEQLAAAARDHDQRALIAVALRADFYGRVVAYPEFAQLLHSSHMLVGPMDRGELASAIQGPAARAGLEVEQPLVDALVADVAGEPGGLPLLSTMLLELWQARERRTLRYESYRASGGVRGAVARLAERAFTELGERERAVARNIMLRLVSDQDRALVRRRVPLAELHQIDGADRVLAALTDARLVTVSDGEVELSHEALLHEWPRYRGWLEEDAEGRRLHRHLADAARSWDGGGRDPDDLYAGARLASALEWRADNSETLNRVERDFLAAAEVGDRRRRALRRRRVQLSFGGLVLALVAISAVALVAINQGAAARRQRDIVVSRQLAASAQTMVASDPGLSLALARLAIATSPTAQAAAALRQAALAYRSIAVLRPPGGEVYGVDLTADGQLAVGASADGRLRVWRVRDRALLMTYAVHRGGADAPRFGPGGRWVVSGGRDGAVTVTDLASRRNRVIMRDPGVTPFWVALSEDGRTVAGAYSDGTVRIGALAGRPSVRVLSAGRAQVFGVAFSPDGRRVASTSGDGVVHIWNLERKSRPLVFRGDSNGILGVTFDHAGHQLITGDADGWISFWDARTGKQDGRVRVSADSINAVSLSADGRRIAVASGETVPIIDAASRQVTTVLRRHDGYVTDARFASRGDRVISGGEDGTVRLWDPGTTRVISGPVTSAQFSPDGSRVLTGGTDGTVRIWDAATGRLERALRGPTAQTVALGFSRDGRHVVAVATDGTAPWMWSAPSWAPQRIVDNDNSNITAVDADHSARHIVIGDSAGRVVVRSLTGAPPEIFTGHSGAVDDVSFSSDDRMLVSAGSDGTVRLWDTRRANGPLKVFLGHHGPVESAAFSPDGQRVVSAGDDGTVRVWRVAGGTPVVLRGNAGRVDYAAFSPHGDRIISAGVDGSILLWDSRGGAPLVTLHQHRGPAWSASFSPDGSQVVSSGRDGIAWISSCEVCGSLSDVMHLATDARAQRPLTSSERQRYGGGG